MVMDSNQKTIKGAQSVYRVLNILEERGFYLEKD